MSKKFLISVTREDIERGVLHNGACCPVARAIQRATGDPTVEVATRTVESMNLKQTPLPDGVRQRIFLFDTKGTMEPFSFELEFPE